jgi:hypothetical protein
LLFGFDQQSNPSVVLYPASRRQSVLRSGRIAQKLFRAGHKRTDFVKHRLSFARRRGVFQAAAAPVDPRRAGGRTRRPLRIYRRGGVRLLTLYSENNKTGTYRSIYLKLGDGFLRLPVGD